MTIIAQRSKVADMIPRLTELGKSDGWTTRYLDPATGQRWTRIQLDAEFHGGGQPVLIPDPAPSVTDLLTIAKTSEDPAEIAASAWILADSDKEGTHREELIAVAEGAARKGDQERAALLVGWGELTNSANLRPTLGKSPGEVSADHDYFKALADRAKALLRLTAADPLLRDPRVFEG